MLQEGDFLLLQEGDFFEGAAEGGAVGGGEEEAAEGVDAVDGGGDAAVVVDVFCRHVAVEEQGEVFVVEVGAVAQGGVASFDVVQQVVQQGFQLVFLACQQSQRRGVGHPRREGGLVDVEAYAADGGGEDRLVA